MVFMEEKLNIKGPDSHQCSLIGGPGTIEEGAPLVWHGRGPGHPICVKANGVRQQFLTDRIEARTWGNQCN